jgi:glycosyltransferase domain-containing protein
MRDFTLVIPTYNRAQQLSALLSYLETEQADCRVLVLDSSSAVVLEANHERVAASNLDADFAVFTDVDADEKWRQGIHKVSTPFCALCADDDLVILRGVRRCLDTLRENPAVSVAQGYSFTFLPRPDGDMELNNIVYFTPSIQDSSPLERLNKLFEIYQAPTYGIFRTPALQRIFDVLRPMTKNLLHELLWSALAAVDGQLIRLPDFSYGRSMAPSGTYEHWHPLEWFCKDPDSLCAEYLRYREILTAEVIQRSDNEHPFDQVHNVLDLIHLRYLARHAPRSALDFILQQEMARIAFAEYWSRDELHLPLYEAAGIVASKDAKTLKPVEMRGRDRSYLLFPSFYAPRSIDSPQLSSVIHLISTLDGYAISAPRLPVQPLENKPHDLVE